MLLHVHSMFHKLLWLVVMICLYGGTCKADSYPSVTNLSDLVGIVNEPWTNSSMARIMPPGNFAYNSELGVITFQNGFELGLMSALVPTTNDDIQVFNITVVETNTSPRVRFYRNSEGVAVYTSTVSMSSYPQSFVTNTFGPPPSYLTGTNLDQWYSDRDPARQTVSLELLNITNLPAYIASLTNRIGTVDGESNSVSLLEYYGNNIAFVRQEVLLSGAFRYYIHAPTNVSLLNVFTSTNLLATRGGWMWPAKMTHDADPFVGSCGIMADASVFLAADDAEFDSDGDGLPDSMEMRIYGTDPNSADTDGDGLSDGQEVLTYGCSPLLASTDGSGMTDGQKIALGLNPNVSDSDNDGLSDYDEVNKYFTDPKNADTDGDGTLDGAEIHAGTYPRYFDTDGDGLTDTVENAIGSSPFLADTDRDGIDDKFEHITTNFNPLVASDASGDNDTNGISNLNEYMWLYDPNASYAHYWAQKLVIVPPGINGIRVSSDDQFKLLAPGNWSCPAKLWIRPLRDNATTNLVPQLLYHSQTPGFYINGSEASGLASPITIPAVRSNTEFVITSTSAAWGTNIIFRLAKTNGSVSCSAYAYSPKITAATFFTALPNNATVNFKGTGTLYYCMSDPSNKPNLFINPTQYPTGGLGFPYYTYNNWLLFSVDGSGCSYIANTLNCHDYRSAYGDMYGSRLSTGMKFDPGKYCINVGFDMNGNAVLDADEIEESCKLTVFRAVLEPITCSPYSNPVDNPSGIKVGGTATYKIAVEPSTISDSDITWSSTNANITFPDGNHGRSVSVSATAQGLAQLKVDVAGYTQAPPTINVKGLTNSTVNVSFYVICDSSGVPSVSANRISNDLARVNGIYEQVAMTFAQQGSITYITNQDWMDIQKEMGSYPYLYPKLFQITSFTNGTGGLEVYYVGSIEDASGLFDPSPTGQRGIAVSAGGSSIALAHEIGHACGLKDIYCEKGGVSIDWTNHVKSAWAPQDWNGGPSPLYYESDRRQSELITRLLMYGVDDGFHTERDIPLGKVYGVKVSSGTNYTADLEYVGLDNSGFPMKRSPFSY